MTDEQRDAGPYRPDPAADDLPAPAAAADPKGGVLIGLLLPYKPVVPIAPGLSPKATLGDGSV